MDVRDSAAVNQTLSELPDEWKEVKVLINNAGLAVGLDTIQEGNIEDWDTMIDTNVKGLLYVSRAVIPWMIERGGGHIVNLGSTAGKEVYLKGNVYCATKHAVDALTKAMRIDLLPHRIRVTSISPGAVETDFSTVRFKGDTERAAQVYANYEPLTAADIAEVIWFALSRPPHVCINDVVLTPLAQANAFYWHKDA